MKIDMFLKKLENLASRKLMLGHRYRLLKYGTFRITQYVLSPYYITYRPYYSVIGTIGENIKRLY